MVLPAAWFSQFLHQRWCQGSEQCRGGPTHPAVWRAPAVNWGYDCYRSNDRTTCSAYEASDLEKRAHKKLKLSCSMQVINCFQLFLTILIPSPRQSISYFSLSGIREKAFLDFFCFFFFSAVSLFSRSFCFGASSSAAFFCFSNWNSKYFRLLLPRGCSGSMCEKPGENISGDYKQQCKLKQHRF